MGTSPGSYNGHVVGDLRPLISLYCRILQCQSLKVCTVTYHCVAPNVANAVKVKWGKQKFDNVEVDTDDTPEVFKMQLFSLSGEWHLLLIST